MKRALFLCTMLILLAGSLYCQDEESDIRSLILADGSVKDHDITILRRINMGIPGGDNWLVEFKYNIPGEVMRYNVIFIYVINESKIIQEKNFQLNFYISNYSDFDIMKDIPGTRIGEGSCVVYDYNGDGYDEVFNFEFSGRGRFVQIFGYDFEKESIVNYAGISFEIIDRENGPAPAEFISYKGMKGFKVYLSEFEVAGGPDWVPDPNLINGRWFFYTWDKIWMNFVRVEEYEEGWEETYNEKTRLALTEDLETQEEPTIVASDDNGTNTQFPFYIVIIAAVALAAAVFIMVRRRKGGK